MPSRSATIIANDVAWPWPCAEVPDITVAEPSGSIRTLPSSLPPKPVISTYVETPMPSSRSSPASIRRACSARSASTSATRSASWSAAS